MQVWKRIPNLQADASAGLCRMPNAHVPCMGSKPRPVPLPHQAHGGLLHQLPVACLQRPRRCCCSCCWGCSFMAAAAAAALPAVTDPSEERAALVHLQGAARTATWLNEGLMDAAMDMLSGWCVFRLIRLLCTVRNNAVTAVIRARQAREAFDKGGRGVRARPRAHQLGAPGAEARLGRPSTAGPAPCGLVHWLLAAACPGCLQAPAA